MMGMASTLFKSVPFIAKVLFLNSWRKKMKGHHLTDVNLENCCYTDAYELLYWYI